MPELEGAGGRQHPQQPDRRGANQVGADEQQAAVVSVAEHAPNQDEEQEGEGPSQTNHRQGGGHVADLVHLPGQGDVEEPIAEERDERADSEQRKVALDEWLEDADAEDARAE